MINHGPDNGKIATIIDIVDQNRALVDGPHNMTGVDRHQVNFKSLALTPLTVPIARNPRPALLAALLKKEDILNKWSTSNWARKLTMKRIRSSMTDMDRFRSMIITKKRKVLIGKEVKRLQRAKEVPPLRPRVPPKFVPLKKKPPKPKKTVYKPVEDDKKKKSAEAAEEGKEEGGKKKKK